MLHSERKGRRLIASYFFTYMIVLVIPIIAAVFVSAGFTGTLKDQIEQENAALTRQAAQILDAEINSLDSFAARLAENPALKTLLENEKLPEKGSAPEGRLPLPSSACGALYDYAVFFQKSMSAVDYRLLCSLDIFYTQRFHDAGQTLEEWETEIFSPLPEGRRCRVRRIWYGEGDDSGEKEMIELSYPLSAGSGNGRIVLYVEQQRLISLLSAAYAREDEIAWIEAEDGGVLASTCPDQKTAEALRSSFSGDTESTGTARVSANGKEMLVSRCRSPQTGIGVVYARPADQVLTPMGRTQRILVISLIAALALGVLFSYLYSRYFSSFFSQLAARGGMRLESMDYRQALQNLKKSFEDIQTANDNMTQTLESQRLYLQRAFLSQLLNGDFSNEENALAIARNIPSFQLEQPMRVVLIHFSGESGMTGEGPDLQLSDNWKSVIRMAVESLENDALHLSRSENDDVLLLCGNRLEERIDQLVKLIRSNLPEGINELLFVYVGNPVDRLTDVVRSWDNASSMVYLQPSPAEVPVQYYPGSGKPQISVFYPQDMQRRLINSVMNGDDQETLEILKDLKENNRQDNAIPAYIIQLLIDNLLSTLLQINNMAGLPQDRAETILSGVKSLMTLPISAQLDMVDMLYSSLCGEIQKMKSEGGKQQIIDEISAFIREHYMDADLSLAKVADRFHVSESYLSFTFKAQKGTNFFSFVEGLRIARAKELLRHTNLKISDIAEQVGYASANSFCRAFKRSTGENASNYRNGTEESEN